MKKKTFVMALALVLVFAVAVGGVVAWLTDKTDPVTNTFTVGDIKIYLTETGTDIKNEKTYKIIPGDTASKDPKVTVEGGSEECYLFVKVDAANNTINEKQIVNYAVDESVWTELGGAGNEGVYYRVVNASNADQSFYVLTGDNGGQVTINEDLTKADVKAIGENHPTLTFTAYAVQKAHMDSAAAAWAEASK